MIDSAVFIGAIVIAITEAIKLVAPGVKGALTTLVAMAVGVLVALLAPALGVAHVTIGGGILIALAAVGTHTVASAISTRP